MDRDVDELLRRNAERQLAGLDWDRQRQTVMHGLVTPAQKPRKIIAIRIAAGIAAVLALAVGYMCMSLLKDTGRDVAAPIETTAMHESVENDPLLASTDPKTILLIGPMRLLALNDPMLAPHSPWDQ